MSKRLIGVAMLVGIALAFAGCASHQVKNQWPDDTRRVYHAVVTNSDAFGPPDPVNDVARLKAYYQALQELVGVSNLEEQFIGCVGCSQLATSPPAQLKFIFYRQHEVDLYAFIMAWQRVHASSIASPRLVLTFDAEQPPDPTCSKPIPLCYPAPSCPETQNCDANRNLSGCQPCV